MSSHLRTTFEVLKYSKIIQVHQKIKIMNTMKGNKNVELKNKKDVTPTSKTKNKRKNNLKSKKTVAQIKKGDRLRENIKEAISNKEVVTVVNEESTKKDIKRKKAKLNKEKKPKLEPSQETLSSKQEKINGALTEKDLAKIAKKKAKKLAQKLKKQQLKNEDLKGIKDSKKGSTVNVEIKIKKEKASKNLISTKSDISSESIEAKIVNPKKQRKADKKKLTQKQKSNSKEESSSKKAPVDFEVATVFIGNLPVNTKRIQLVRLFEKYGPISAIRFRTAGGKSILKHKQRKEAGSLNAYMVLKDEATAEKALELNGIEFKSNHLRVTRVGKGVHKTENAETKSTIFVGNLKYSATEEKLREIFSSCGDIEYIRCIREGEKGCKGVAYVCFKSPDAVSLALELNETMLDERPIHVERYSVKKLGAKEAREQSVPAQGNKKVQSGAQKRLSLKKKMQSDKSPSKSGNDADKKKSEFRGVKVDVIKKKQKKKKPSSQLKQIAKKIAPKTN